MGDVVPFISKREIKAEAELLKAEIALWELHQSHMNLLRAMKAMQVELAFYKELSTSRLLRIIELENANGKNARRTDRSPSSRV